MQSVHQHAPARPWWSRSSSNSKPASDKQPNGSSKQSKKLTTLATAIGLKPRKQALTIQEPPSPILPLHTGNLESPPLPPTIRPKTGASWDEFVEPKTPSDAPKHLSYTQSVMTQSEKDPFAARFIPTSPMTLASNRISTFSDLSMSSSGQTDFTLGLNRQSYTSSSDASHSYHSHHLPPPLLPTRTRSLPRADVPVDVGSSPPLLSPIAGSLSSDSWRASRLTTTSEKIVRREPPFLSADATTSPPHSAANMPQIRTSPSSSTLTDRPPSSDAHVVRPKSRPRGMTDVGPSTRTRSSPTAPNTRVLQVAASARAHPQDALPPVVIRQPSLTRVRAIPAPVAPPAAQLPLPPTAGMPHRLREPSPTSASSSDISFASTSSKHDRAAHHHLHPRSQERDSRSATSVYTSGRDVSRAREQAPREAPSATASSSSFRGRGQPSHSTHRSEFSPTRTIKKAISAQSLKRTSNGSTVTATALPAQSVEDVSTKSVKKQRSFHHSRIPLPPLPTALRPTSSAGSVPHAAVSQSEAHVHTQRRVSNASHTSPVAVQTVPSGGRRRLFSGSSLRRSISSQAHSTNGDDDVRSIFSLDEVRRPKSSSQRPMTATTTTDTSHESQSFWDDHDPEPPLSPGVGGGNYAPQHIMAPADMLKLEAALSRGDPPPDVAMMRTRGMSLTSVATSLSGTFSDVGLSVEGGESVLAPHSPMSLSPCSSNSVRCVATVSNSSCASPIPRVDSATPRTQAQQRRPSTAQPDSPTLLSPDTASAMSGPSLSPPPRHRTRPTTSDSSTNDKWDRRLSTAPVIPLSPPPAWKGLGRGRKHDEAQSRNTSGSASAPKGRPTISRRPSFLEIEENEPPRRSIDDSFLDMGKASFDTTRSSFEEDFGR